ncbi:predicted protein [Sclerotinia sclerotiorum 1980 UF-70]|uniref:Uncharacterized protein n=1 Tax=Sclerotinia sclerotiorum (strain ATCC 18683 / 1980 / Ss-1) TaxID=665079 RepID=A7F1F6_SCLS1|nr:predicted protein [Sclerotinia sclerotiorum 1980 UF-70]EDN95548.1 predicted protein [Sclerotinia sclerotiorum 1980 UF-70]
MHKRICIGSNCKYFVIPSSLKSNYEDWIKFGLGYSSLELYQTRTSRNLQFHSIAVRDIFMYSSTIAYCDLISEAEVASTSET